MKWPGRKFFKRPRAARQALIKSAFLIILVRLGLSVVPFNKLRQVLKRLESVARPQKDDTEVAWLIWATNHAGHYLLPNKPCLTQALVLQWLLQRRQLPCELHIGVRKNIKGTLAAHAWVTYQGEVIIGGTNDDIKQYQPFLNLENKKA